MDRLSPEIGHVRNLVVEHLVDGLSLQDLFTGGRGSAVVEERGDDLDVFAGLCEETSAGGVEDFFLLSLGVVVQGPTEKMITSYEVSIWVALVHVC